MRRKWGPLEKLKYIMKASRRLHHADCEAQIAKSMNPYRRLPANYGRVLEVTFLLDGFKFDHLAACNPLMSV